MNTPLATLGVLVIAVSVVGLLAPVRTHEWWYACIRCTKTHRC